MPILCRVVAIMLMLLTLVESAPAQSALREAGPILAPFTQRALTMCCDRLGFDADQKAAARALHQGYRTDFNALLKEAEAEEKKADETQDFDQGAHADKYLGRIRDLEAGLLEDLRSLCTPEQAGRFPAVERARRREIGGRLAFAAGDGIDLVNLLESEKVERSEAMDEILGRWEENVDRVEIDRDRLVRGAIKKLAGGGDGDPHAKAVTEFMSSLIKISVRRRDATRRTLRELEGVLPAERHAQIERKVRALSFPRIWGPSDVEKAMEAAAGFADISPEQKTQIDDLRQRYAREAEPINTRWAAATEAKQEQLGDDFMALVMQGEEAEGDPFYAARTERRSLDETTMQRLREILKEEQRARLPEPQQRFYQPEFIPDFEQFEEEWEAWENEEE